jgi:hypothetical protein
LFQDIETALDGADRSGKAFDATRILRRRAAGSVAGAGQARDQPVGGLGVTAEGNDYARTRFREQACGRGTQAFAAACHQRNPSVEYAHDRSPLGLVPMAKCALRWTRLPAALCQRVRFDGQQLLQRLALRRPLARLLRD